MIVEFVVLELLSTIEPVGKPSSSRDGDWCKKRFSLHVTNREDAFDVRLLPLVDDDIPRGVKFDTDVLETKLLGICLATDCPN
jgi:hypothetical protein